MSRRLRSPALLTAALFALALTACPGYHLAGRGGPSASIPPEIRTIGIPPLVNETDRPETEQRLTEALIDEFIRRGRYETLPGQAGADAVLRGTIVSFRTEPMTFTERGRFDRVEVVVTASISLVRSSPESVLWAQNHFTFREQYDVPETPLTEFDREIVAIEEIAEGFARSVVTSILEGF